MAAGSKAPAEQLRTLLHVSACRIITPATSPLPALLHPVSQPLAQPSPHQGTPSTQPEALPAPPLPPTQAGARGRWLILEEALLTLADDKAACAFADTTVVHSSSKAAAYTTFRRLAEAESGKADQEQQMLLGLPPADGQMTPQLWLQQLASKLPEPVTSRLGVPVVPATAAAAPSEAAAVQEAAVEEVAPAQQSIFQGLLDAIMPGEQAGGADKQAVVVTLVVAARGRLEVPAAGNWQQLRHAMQVGIAPASPALRRCVMLLWRCATAVVCGAAPVTLLPWPKYVVWIISHWSHWTSPV